MRVCVYVYGFAFMCMGVSVFEVVCACMCMGVCARSVSCLLCALVRAYVCECTYTQETGVACVRVR